MRPQKRGKKVSNKQSLHLQNGKKTKQGVNKKDGNNYQKRDNLKDVYKFFKMSKLNQLKKK